MGGGSYAHKRDDTRSHLLRCAWWQSQRGKVASESMSALHLHCQMEGFSPGGQYKVGVPHPHGSPWNNRDLTPGRA